MLDGHNTTMIKSIFATAISTIFFCYIFVTSENVQTGTEQGMHCEESVVSNAPSSPGVWRHMERKRLSHCGARGKCVNKTTKVFTIHENDLEVLNTSNGKIVQIHGTSLLRANIDINARLIHSDTVRIAIITIGEENVAFVSVSHFHALWRMEISLFEVAYNSSSSGQSDEQLLWTLSRKSMDDFPMVMEANRVKVIYKCFSTLVHDIFIFYFSFHKKEDPMLKKLPNGQWNCSIDNWPDFEYHFRCDIIQECYSGEDEMHCPHSGECGQGRVTLSDRCYWLVWRDRKQSWHEAQSSCARQGGYLASLNTIKEWNEVFDMMNSIKLPRYYYIGLQDSPSNWMSYYTGTYRWADNSLVIYARTCHTILLWHLACGFVDSNRRNEIQVYSKCHASVHDSYLCEGAKPVSSDQADVVKPKVQIRSPRESIIPVPHSQCPNGHFTHSFLACDILTACWGIQDRVYIDASNDVAGKLSASACPADVTPLPPSFTCRTEEKGIAYTLVCDGLIDCADKSDENFCRFSDCTPDRPTGCHDSSLCLPANKVCDGQRDCPSGDDELLCATMNPATYERSILANYIAGPVIVNLNSTQWWNYLNVSDVGEGSQCPESHFNCAGHEHCLPVYLRCNEVYDCPNHEDEADCATYQCPGFYRCRASTVCVHGSQVCDGLYQCPQKDDEIFCHLDCPRNCTCHGLAFVCDKEFHAQLHPNLRYLDGRYSMMGPHQLTENTLLVFLSLAHCALNHLANFTFQNLRILDVSYNNITDVSIDQLSQMDSLGTLVLAGNPLTAKHLFQDGSSERLFKSMRFLQLADTDLTVIDSRMFRSFPNLEKLNLSNSGVVTVVDDGLRSVTKLDTLDVRGCPMTFFPDGLFRKMYDLHSVFTDNYKLCCRVLLPKGFNLNRCHAPYDEISSCDALLRSNFYRVMLSIFAACSMLGNLASFLIRIFWFKGKKNSSFVISVSNLCMSDFLMGLYLGLIGVADRLFLDSYLWKDVTWRHSLACNVAGFLSLLSNEVSALVVCFITLDRFLVLRFPFSSIKFNAFSAMLVCAIIWVGCAILAAVPLLSITKHWNFYSQTGICIPLPITTKNFPGHSYAFGLIIVFNFVLFLLIATGQVSIFLSIQANRMAVTDTTRKAQDLKIARRLIIIAVSDFVCWFPIGILGLLASQGLFIPGEVNVAMAILVLPLNSTLNPFLYNLNMLLEKRQRLREEKWLKDMKQLILKEQQ